MIRYSSLKRNVVICRHNEALLFICSNVLQSCLFPKFLSSSEVMTALRPFYFLVHPDLFAQYPRAQNVNDVNLKLLNSHFDSLINNNSPTPLHLQFYIRNKFDEGALTTKMLTLNDSSLKLTVQSVLETFGLPTKYVDSLDERKRSNAFYFGNSANTINMSSFRTRQNAHEALRKKDLYSWLISNMGEAEKRLLISKPIREDIICLRDQLLEELGLGKITWVRGIGTVHLRGCLQNLRTVVNHPGILEIVQGRHIHFGNETGLSLRGSVVLSTSEVRDQWFKLLSSVEEREQMVHRIPHMQKTVSNVLQNIKITHRKYQSFLLAENYSRNLKRLVTSLGDYRGKTGFPNTWPASLDHLQLVVESASGPLMLSPTGQIIAPSSCPPSLLINFITENMQEASQRIKYYEIARKREKFLLKCCQEELGLEFLDKDDSIVPEKMVECLERLLQVSYKLSPLLTGARLWITQYYSVMLDGEVCIPWNWDRDAR